MTSFARKTALSLCLGALAFALGTTPVEAKTAHQKHHKHQSRVVKQKEKADKSKETKELISRAQEHLAHLGYYVGKVDGRVGPATKAALKTFQREHGLKADGVLGSKTRLALEDADRVILPRKSDFTVRENPTPTDMEVHQDFHASLNGEPKIVSSRFARLDVAETGEGAEKRYVVNLNGQPILMANGQPSVIGVSTTYDLGNEDAVVFTTFSPDEVGCMYKNRVLAMNPSGAKLLDIENCTRNYQARVDQGSLYVSFPERDDNRSIGATWRLEGINLQRL